MWHWLAFPNDLKSLLVNVEETLSIPSWVLWILSNPVGIKLNCACNELIAKYVLLFTDVVMTALSSSCALWTTTFLPITPMVALALQSIGFSLQISLLLDFMSMCMLHLQLLRMIFQGINGMCISLMSTLFRLFRSQKMNILRKGRVDSCHVDIDVAFLGTLAFILLLFTYPTVAVYYMFFNVQHVLFILAPRLLLSAFLLTWNRFPFCEYTLHVCACRKVRHVEAQKCVDDSLASRRRWSHGVIPLRQMEGTGRDVLRDYADAITALVKEWAADLV